MHRIGYVTAPGFQIMGLAAMSVFEVANLVAGETVYEMSTLSETGGAIRSSMGLEVQTQPFDSVSCDTLLVGGGFGMLPTSRGLADMLRAAYATTRRIASICTGASVLADAGLLDGRRVTTHWSYARELKARFPKILMEEDRIFIIDGPIWTSAGMSAGIDLALGMIEKDLGADLARATAQKMVVYHRRAGGQSQFSALLEMDAKSDRIQSALAFAKDNLHTALSVDQLADAAHLSPRQFSRAFRAETGQSPAKAVEHLRVEAARMMMEQGSHPIDVVANETGFADRERMRRAFLRAFGQPPQVIRRNARLAAA